MRPLHFFALITFVIAVTACKNRRGAVTKTAHPAGVLVDNFDEYANSAAVRITSAMIDKNMMTIEVEYSGGCEKHEFTLLGSKMIQKSLPPKRGLMLYHTNNDDSCRELVADTLRFDISAFAYQKEEIILLLEGYEQPLSYTLAN